MSAGNDIVDEYVDGYLDELLLGLRGRPGEVRRMLAETEEHLLCAIDDDEARGTPREQAARAAVARFGSPAQIARAWNAGTAAEPLGRFLRRMFTQLLPLAGVGLVGVGLSGVAARLMTALWGPAFMFADPPGTTYAASACRYWLSIHPSAGSCGTAYLAESQSDALLARYAAGILGLLLLGAIAVARRRGGSPILAVPSLLASFAATAACVVASLGLLGLGFDSVRIAAGHGAGQWLSGAVVAVPLAAAFGFAFLRAGRRVSLWNGFQLR